MEQFVGPIKEISGLHPLMQSWRREFHSFPETAFNENVTSSLIKKHLNEFGIEYFDRIAGTGVIAFIQNGDGPAIGLRAEMDALHLTEKNAFDHRSKNEGVMHGCGHDGHITMLLGAARYLNETRRFSGTVYFIFQPAEENEGGAKKMIDEGVFERFKMDAVFALHNWPGMPTGYFGASLGPAMASCDRFEIVVRGQGCHAAMPQKGVDTILTASEIVQSLQKIVSRKIDPTEPVVVSVTQIHGGDTDNILPDNVTIRGTVRCFKPEPRIQVEELIENITSGVCSASGAEYDYSYEKGYPATINSDAETNFALETARRLVGNERVVSGLQASMGSEDFSYFLEKVPGAYMRIGNGSDRNGRLLHSPNYDFNDEILPLGASYFALLIENFIC